MEDRIEISFYHLQGRMDGEVVEGYEAVKSEVITYFHRVRSGSDA